MNIFEFKSKFEFEFEVFINIFHPFHIFENQNTSQILNEIFMKSTQKIFEILTSQTPQINQSNQLNLIELSSIFNFKSFEFIQFEKFEKFQTFFFRGKTSNYQTYQKTKIGQN